LKRYINKLTQNSLSKDVVASLVLRSINILLNLVLLPLSISILTSSSYGIWLTIFALNAWVSLFDLGTQNTLRNKLASTIYHPNKLRLRGLLITNSFFFSLILSLIIVFISLVLYITVDFTSVLHIHNNNSSSINLLVFLTLVSFALKLFTNNFNSILLALQKAYLTIFIATLSGAVTILILVYLSFFAHYNISLFEYGIIVLLADLVISIGFPLIYLKKIGFIYKVSLSNYSLKFFKRQLLASSLRFFVISILIVFTFFSDNFFIGILLTYKDVVAYNLVNKYFNVITMISVVVLNPIWTQVSILYLNRNIAAINSLLKKMYLYFLGFIAVCVILLVFDDIFYKKFGDGKIIIAASVSITAAIATLQLLFNNIHAYILNGMNKTGVQIICLTFGAVVIIPIYFTLIKVFHTGIMGSFLVQIIVFLPMSIFLPVCLKKYLKEAAGQKA
jgi:O-antigen/teichoic acid export membrane protein